MGAHHGRHRAVLVPDPGLLVDALDGGHLLVAFVVGVIACLVHRPPPTSPSPSPWPPGGCRGRPRWWSRRSPPPSPAPPCERRPAGHTAGARPGRAGHRRRRRAVRVRPRHRASACLVLKPTAASAIVVVQMRGPWRRCLLAVAAATAAIALFDGEPRPSSQLAGIGIAVLLACRAVRPGSPGGGPGRRRAGRSGRLSLVIGLSEDTDWPALAATAITGVAIAGTRGLGRDPDEDPAQGRRVGGEHPLDHPPLVEVGLGLRPAAPPALRDSRAGLRRGRRRGRPGRGRARARPVTRRRRPPAGSRGCRWPRPAGRWRPPPWRPRGSPPGATAGRTRPWRA